MGCGFLHAIPDDTLYRFLYILYLLFAYLTLSQHLRVSNVFIMFSLVPDEGIQFSFFGWWGKGRGFHYKIKFDQVSSKKN
ncbi:hypothetical protein RIF29_40811 [Crotalaria pallida]|uniref:Uncharacterized protein n=1 Tax=Crotalaria pallida TaxID=3830 RepID=A0AAN9HS12_CROPI